MKRSELAIGSLLNAVGVFLYVLFVSWIMFNAPKAIDARPSVAVPVFMLLLFVVSAAITASLVLGKPILLYLDGRKKEAVTLFLATIGWLVLLLLGMAVVLMLR